MSLRKSRVCSMLSYRTCANVRESCDSINFRTPHWLKTRAKTSHGSKPSPDVTRRVNLWYDANSSLPSGSNDCTHVSRRVHEPGPKRTVCRKSRKRTRDVWEALCVDDMPVQSVEFDGCHRVQMLEDDRQRVVVPRCVDHRRAQWESWSVRH